MSKEDSLKERMQSAYRMRQIRENSGLTQEQMAEILGISSSGYKKVESGENSISISSLRCLHKEMNVSADHVLFGETKSIDGAWEEILNCSETDKLFLMLRLITYFTKTKKGIYPLAEEQSEEDKGILQLIDKLQKHGKD